MSKTVVYQCSGCASFLKDTESLVQLVAPMREPNGPLYRTEHYYCFSCFDEVCLERDKAKQPVLNENMTLTDKTVRIEFCKEMLNVIPHVVRPFFNKLVGPDFARFHAYVNGLKEKFENEIKGIEGN